MIEKDDQDIYFDEGFSAETFNLASGEIHPQSLQVRWCIYRYHPECGTQTTKEPGVRLLKKS